MAVTKRILVSGDDEVAPPAAQTKETTKKRHMIAYEEEALEEGEVKVIQVSSSLDSVDEAEAEAEDDDGEHAKPIGTGVRVSGEGDSKRTHFLGFEANGISYHLEDTVLVIPDTMNFKPSVALIKDVWATLDGEITVTGRRFYRPEVVGKTSGGNREIGRGRELFYSFDKTEFPAYDIMHKCKVHFIPQNKKIPPAREHPGFIVQKVYDASSKELADLLDKGFEDYKKREINRLIKKTSARIPNLQEFIASGETRN